MTTKRSLPTVSRPSGAGRRTSLRAVLAAFPAVLGLAGPAHAIVGGGDASPGEYPYVAHILIDRSFQCTGTLVTPTHVVTAAHVVPGGGGAGR